MQEALSVEVARINETSAAVASPYFNIILGRIVMTDPLHGTIPVAETLEIEFPVISDIPEDLLVPEVANVNPRWNDIGSCPPFPRDHNDAEMLDADDGSSDLSDDTEMLDADDESSDSEDEVGHSPNVLVDRMVHNNRLPLTNFYYVGLLGETGEVVELQQIDWRSQQLFNLENIFITHVDGVFNILNHNCSISCFLDEVLLDEGREYNWCMELKPFSKMSLFFHFKDF